MHWLISVELLYNFALCYLASGNLWLSFCVKRGIQVTGGRDGKCVIYHKCNRNNLVYFWVSIKTWPLGAWQKVFSGRPSRQQASKHCFHNVSKHRMLPSLVCVFHTVKMSFWLNSSTTWHLGERWWAPGKDSKMDREGKGRKGSPACEGLGCWTKWRYRNKRKKEQRREFRVEHKASLCLFWLFHHNNLWPFYSPLNYSLLLNQWSYNQTED